jgi:hypothetical protein
MKKLLSATLAVALVFGASSAIAQTMYIGAGPLGGAPSALFDVPGGIQFDVVATLDPGGESSSAAEFVMSELNVINPGIFKLGTAKFNGALDLGENSLGEYILAFQGCFPDATVEMVRVTYGTFGGTPAPDTVLTLRGFQAGDTQPSSFNGELGFIDCSDNGIVATLGGTDGGFTGADVEFPDGSCVLNATPVVVDNEAGSMGQLKTRF